MITLEQVGKEYGGWISRARGRRVRGLSALSLTVPPGVALGVVGPNGAGKSTLIRLLLGYLRPSSGRLTIDEMEPRAYVQAKGVAYVPEVVAIPPSWSVQHALLFHASLGNVGRGEVDAALQRVGLEDVRSRKVGALSKGMLQRAALAQALLAPRRLMVLDEPTSGLDPEWIAETRAIVAEWRAADPQRVVLIASHDLSELERTVDRVAVLEGGTLREVIDLRARPDAFPAYLLEVEESAGVGAAVHACFPGAVAEDADPLRFRLQPRDAADLARGTAALLARGVTLRALTPEVESLEQRFRARPRGDA
jgi:ABC-2 type transport system ATP-binding protein